MSRTNASARKAGAAFEKSVADYLALQTGQSVERRRLNGSNDRGDITGLSMLDCERVVIECKDCARVELAAWIAEAEREAANDGANVNAVAFKRRGVAEPGRQYVLMTLETFAYIASGCDRCSRW